MTALAFLLLAIGFLALAAASHSAPARLPVRLAGRATRNVRAIGCALPALALVLSMADGRSWALGLLAWLGLASVAAGLVVLALAPLRVRKSGRSGSRS